MDRPFFAEATMRTVFALSALALLVACGSDPATTVDAADTAAPIDTAEADTSASVDTAPADTVPADTSPPREKVACGSGGWPLPEGLAELRWDDGEDVSSVPAQSWAVTLDDGVTYTLADGPLWEAVRFDLPHPAEVWGFSIKWDAVPSDASADLVAGLYPDLGHNGFDFRHDDPLWVGTRCAGDAAEDDGWVTYAFEAPVTLARPGLVYVAQLRPDAGSPALRFDGSAAEDCSAFDACHSAVNLPDAAPGTFDVGATLQVPNDFMVRLHLAYSDDLKPEERLFQPLADGPSVGRRVSWGDYDGDGWDDLFTNGPHLYRNTGGAFEEVTEAAGLTGLRADGGVWGDYDGDGCLDLFVFAQSVSSPDTLMRSRCDGTFEDVTAAAGIVDYQEIDDCGAGEAGTNAPSAAAAWADLDGDGFLDLYIANYFCGPAETRFPDTVWHNRGDGTFEDWSGSHGFSTLRTPSRGVNPVDADGDGDVDLLINNYRLVANLYYENAGDGTFHEHGALSGLAGHLDSRAGLNYFGHSIGTAWGDLDGDGDMDAVIANLAHPRFMTFSDKTQLMLQDAATGRFSDRNSDWSGPLSDAGIEYEETDSVPALADFDADGALDLVITRVYDGRPTGFYWGNGDGTFRLDSYHAGITTTNGWGLATADLDHDGDPDLAASGVFVNDVTTGGRWLSVAVVDGLSANTAAIGATVRVMAGGRPLLRHVQGGSGQGGQDSRYLHFGLGEAESVDAISVTFPGGQVVDFAGPVAADQRVWLTRSGALTSGWAPPGE